MTTEVRRNRPGRDCSWRSLLSFWMAGVLVCASGWLAADDASVESDRAAFNCSAGFGHRFKPGIWVPLQIGVDDVLAASKFAATVPDGNGIPTTIEGPLLKVADGRYQGLVKIGRTSGTMNVELFDDSEEALAKQQFEFGTGETARAVGSTAPLALVVEPKSAIRDLVKSVELQLFDGTCEAVAIDDAAELPVHWLGYQSVETLYLSTSNLKLAREISEQQIDAISQWVRQGGKLVIFGGVNGGALFNDSSPLSKLLPGDFESQEELSTGARLEWYASSRQPLLARGSTPLTATRLAPADGSIAEPDQSALPVVVRQPSGFGQLIFCAVDLDSGPVAAWEARRNLLLKATRPGLNLNQIASTDSEVLGVARVGYRDLIGQLMLPLEQFRRAGFLNFTVVAILIALFILCVGPGDFFLLRRVAGRMEWTWITFPLLALAFCAAAIGISRAISPGSIQMNQLEIVDIDAASGVVRGTQWSNVYSPISDRCDIGLPESSGLGLPLDARFVSWMGIPGEGLGSMQSSAARSFGEVAYQILIDIDVEVATGESRLQQMPTGVSSTRTLLSRYTSQFPQNVVSRLRLDRARNRLRGTVTNPLEQKISGCRLLFENWAYVMDRPLLPGETIDVYSEMTERTSNFYFSRQVREESDKGGGLPWNPQDDNIDRIAEMLMFHRVAGGRGYTGMTHGFLSSTDLSEQVSLRRAILFGKVDNASTELEIESNTGSAEIDQANTWVRIIMPVDAR